MERHECLVPTDPGRTRLASECVNKDFYPTLDQLVWSEDSVTNKLYSVMPKNSLMCLLRETVSQLEAATKDKEKSIVAMIENKFDDFEEKIKKIDALDEKIEQKFDAFEDKMNSLKQEVTAQEATIEEGSYASKVREFPTEVRKALQEAKNDEKVEDNEKETRTRNFVIHGSEELGENTNQTKDKDKQYICDILKKLEVPNQPESVARLGAPTKTGKRPIKVIMKSKEDQQLVMKNLRRLKGTEPELGKISVTEDYTQNERGQIKEWNKKAKELSANDKEYQYKVRGDPKNGLRLIRLARN